MSQNQEEDQDKETPKKRGRKPNDQENGQNDELIKQLLKQNEELTKQLAQKPTSNAPILTVSTMEHRQREQLEQLHKLGVEDREGSTETITGNMDSSYTLRKREANMFHVRLVIPPTERDAAKMVVENGKLVQQTELKSKVQIMSQRTFKRMTAKDSNTLKMYTAVIVLHDPTRNANI